MHLSTAQAAREVIEDGADGLAHVWADQPATPEDVALARRHGIFLVPTLGVLAGTCGDTATARTLAADTVLRAYLNGREIRSLSADSHLRRHDARAMANARMTVAAMRAAGVPILAGTDAPNPTTAHGVSLHGELSLLVDAGLSPVEALAGATSVPATAFRLTDRGRIEPGRRADLLLVDGDPTRDIRATRRIAMVWKGGVSVDRRTAPVETVVPSIADGTVSDFETDLSSRFGSGWQVSTNRLMGGSSDAAMQVVRGGAKGSRGSLEITGSIEPGSAFPWAGAMFFPGPQPMAPANLARFQALSFWTKGDGAAYRVLLFASRLGRIPAEQRFVAGPSWREEVMPFASFGAGIDGSDVQAVLFSAGPGQTRFRLQIDRVRFQ